MKYSVVLGLTALIACSGAVGAQTAVDRAGEIKQWRERCSEPDVDLRTAHIEAAIATGDVALIRICSRLALEADDADVRNLGLRAAIAATDQITFDVEMPKELAEAIEKAGTDQKKLNEINRWYAMDAWQAMQSGLVFEIADAELMSGNSEWYPLVALTKRNDGYGGKAKITGTRLTWVGRAYLKTDDCKLDVSLQPGAELQGVFHCSRNMPFPVRASLL
jgi:hypothetical protein